MTDINIPVPLEILIKQLEAHGGTVTFPDRDLRYWRTADVRTFLRNRHAKPAYEKFADLAGLFASHPNRGFTFAEAATQLPWSEEELRHSISHLGRWIAGHKLPRPYFERPRKAAEGSGHQTEKVYWFDQTQAQYWLEGTA